jgi:hypothetical protein
MYFCEDEYGNQTIHAARIRPFMPPESGHSCHPNPAIHATPIIPGLGNQPFVPRKWPDSSFAASAPEAEDAPQLSILVRATCNLRH